MSYMGINPANQLRLTGMATGMDTDDLVKKMTLAEKNKVDKECQSRQKIQWKQEIFRSIMDEMQQFSKKYFDILSPNYILSGNNFSSYGVTSNSTSSYIKLEALSGAKVGTYKVKATKLAESANITGGAINVKESRNEVGNFVIPDKTISLGDHGSITLDKDKYKTAELVNEINKKISKDSKLKDIKAIINDEGKVSIIKNKVTINSSNKNFTLTIDGTPHNISLEKEGEFTLEEIASEINSKLDKEGIKGITAYSVNGEVKFNSDREISGDGVGKYKGEEITSDIDSKCRKMVSKTGDEIRINIPGVGTGKIELGDNATIKDAVNNINDELGKITLDVDGKPTTLLSKIVAEVSNDGKGIKFVSNDGENIKLSGSAMESLGFSSTEEINMSTSDKMSSLIDEEKVKEEVSFTINGVKFNYNFSTNKDVKDENGNITCYGVKDKSIDYILKDISSKADVKASYSQLSKKFTLESSSTGSDQSITVSSEDDNSKDFLSKIFGAATITKSGTDSKVEITDPTGVTTKVYNSKNNFTIDKINYSVNSKTQEEIEFTVSDDSDKSLKNVETMFEDYNKIIDNINSKLREKTNRDFKPLTEEERSSMSEEQIKKWEDKAKSGLLRNDNDLSSILSKFRGAFYGKVDGIGTSFGKYSIGIDISSDFTDGGKIKIVDKEKLKDILKNNPEDIINLFTKKSNTVPYYSRDLNSADKKVRYNEEGVFQRINDIYQEYMGTTRNKQGKKGVLLEKAGLKNDASFVTNLLSKQVTKKDKLIKELTNKLYRKEDYYYKMFAKLETAMNKMNSQSNWLTQQLSGN